MSYAVLCRAVGALRKSATSSAREGFSKPTSNLKRTKVTSLVAHHTSNVRVIVLTASNSVPAHSCTNPSVWDANRRHGRRTVQKQMGWAHLRADGVAHGHVPAGFVLVVPKARRTGAAGEPEDIQGEGRAAVRVECAEGAAPLLPADALLSLFLPFGRADGDC